MIANYLLFFVIFHHRVNLIYSAQDISPEIENLHSNEREELKNSPPGHEIPYSEHENPPEPSTRPKYEAPGQWAKPPADKKIPLEFVPTTMYAQVRGTHTVKRAPRHQALLDASTDEEIENAGRLKEVVTNKKVNTIYTEEGYEDAAYDHAGHQRDADFHEQYDKNLDNEDEFHNVVASHVSSEAASSNEDEDHAEEISRMDKKILNPKKLKNVKYDSKNTFKNGWTVNPIIFVKQEGLKLEKDLMNAAEEVEQAAEIEVPKNLKYLTSDSRSSEDDIIENSTQLRRAFVVNSDERPGKKREYLTTVAKGRYADEAEKMYPSYYDTTPKEYPTYREIMATTTLHPTTINHGKVFWDFFKTQKPSTEATLAPTDARDPKQQHSSENSANSESSEDIDRDSKYVESSREDQRPKSVETVDRRKSRGSVEYSSASREMSRERPKEYSRTRAESSKYSPVTSPGVLQAILKTPQVMKAMRAPTYPRLTSEEAIKTTTSETGDVTTAKRPIYTVIIRPPTKPCDERSDESKLQESVGKYELLQHLTNSVNPRSVNAEALSNASVVKPPAVGPFGQVTYADYLRNSYGGLNKPSETQESGSASEESEQVSLENPRSIPHYQPPPQQQNRILPFFSWLSQLNPVGKFNPPNRMLPPSPMSRSRYAEYAVRRAGGQLPQKNSWSNVPYYNSAFQVNGGAARRFRRQSLGNEQVFSNRGLRKKRSDDDLLNAAPRVTEEIVEGEIKTLLSDESDVAASSDELDNKGEGKVEIYVPEVDFSAALGSIKNHEHFNSEFETKNYIFNNKKYPFYSNNQIPNASPLKYIINPQQIPKKSLGGMEFYNSRDQYLECDDVNPDLSQVLPEEEEPNPDQEPKENLPRLNGLGDKLTCFKAKYFDKNPLDNPLFMEKRIDTPQVPDEFNLRQFKERMSDLSNEPEALVYRRVSRKPEIVDLHSSNRKKNRVVHQSKSKSNHNPAPNHRLSQKRHRGRNAIRIMNPVITSYEKQVYEDVMGTIKNQAGLKPRKSPQDNSSHRRGKKNKMQKEPKPHNVRFERRPAPRNHKVVPYRTDKVTYQMRPRVQSSSGLESRRLGYYKTVRLHKRSIDTELDLQTAESENTQTSGNWIPINISRDQNSGVTTSPVTTTLSFDTAVQNMPKPVWAIKDLTRFSRPRGTVRYGKFQTGGTTTVHPRRKEPRYSDPTKQSNLFYTTAKPELGAADFGDVRREKDEEATAATYEVYEEVSEQLTEAPEVHKLKEYLDSDPPGKSAEISTPYTADKNDGEEEDSREAAKQEESQEDSHEQLEKPSESSTEGSTERVEDEESSSEYNSNEEENAAKKSNAEEDFERFNDRPSSPAENNYDPDYADLGPRINKPAFHHPHFEPPRYERHRGKNAESLEEDKPKKKSSKYVFPWDQDEKVASGELRVAEHRLSKYEYPWDRRERLAREKETKKNRNKTKEKDYYHRYWNKDDDDDDQRSSETGFNFEVTHPWKQWGSPHKDNDFRRFWASDMFDTDEVKPKKFSTKYQKRSEEPSAHVGITRTSKYVPTTTVTPQIPPTSVTSIPRKVSTTPISQVTTKEKSPRYIVRPRSSGQRSIQTVMKATSSSSRTHRDPKYRETVISPITSRPSTFIIRRKVQSTTPRDQKYQNTPSSSTPKSRRQSHTRTTTSRSSTTTGNPPKMHLRRSSHFQHPDIKPESTTNPSKKTVEHRSRVSTEEIITKTSFPESNPLESKRFPSNEDNGLRKSERVQKVSIVTKETPEHIYRTEKIDKNGVKGTFITITPNNSTDKLVIDEDTSMGDISVEDMPQDMDMHERMDDPQLFEDANMGEQHFLASLLMRVPPAKLDWTEGSGEVDQENNFEIRKSEVTYIKEP